MDNPATEPSNAPLDLNSAAALFAAEPVEKEPETAPEIVAEIEAQAKVETQEEDQIVTVKIDGKDVEVPLSELKSGYQKDKVSTERFMQAAETRKSAEAEIAKAHQERQAYAANLQRMQAQLEGTLQQQQQVDWERLLASDPVEYLKQQHLAQKRQATLQQVYAEQQRVNALSQAEQQYALQGHLQAQQEALLAKLPEWKDEGKAKADRSAIREYLTNQGYESGDIDSIRDARAVVLARKAMLFDQMMGKAQAAAKRVSTLPSKVERPGLGDNPGFDRRSAAYQKLGKSGKVEDAAALFASLI